MQTIEEYKAYAKQLEDEEAEKKRAENEKRAEALRQKDAERNAELEKENAALKEKVEELTGELRIARPTFKCAECGEVGPHKWVWNVKEGADFVARRCCDKCIKDKGLTLWPRVRSCEEKCKEFNALKAENEKLRSIAT